MCVCVFVCIKWSSKISTVCDQSLFHGYRRSVSTPWTTDQNQFSQKRQCKQCNFNKINDNTFLHSSARSLARSPGRAQTAISDQYLFVTDVAVASATDACGVLYSIGFEFDCYCNFVLEQDAMTFVKENTTSSRTRAAKEQDKCEQISKHKQDDGKKKGKKKDQQL